MTDQSSTQQDYKQHEQTYRGFVRGSIAMALHMFYILVALVAFGFGGAGAVALGLIGIGVGLAAILFDLKTGSQRWGLSIGLLVLFGLIIAFAIS